MTAPLNVKTIQYNENQFFPKIFNLLPLSIIAQIETTAAQMIHWPCQKVYKRLSNRNAPDPKQKRKKGLGKNASFGRTPQLVFIKFLLPVLVRLLVYIFFTLDVKFS